VAGRGVDEVVRDIVMTIKIEELDLAKLLKTGLAGYQEGILSDLWCARKIGIKGSETKEILGFAPFSHKIV